MHSRLVQCLLLASCFTVLGCKKPPEPTPLPAEIQPDSWIGVELREQREFVGEIRTYRKHVVVVGTVPTAPAETVLLNGDIVVSVGTEAVAKYADLSEAVRRSPEGHPLEIAVLRGDKELTLTVTPERRPGPNALLRRLYVGKRFPALSGMISIAEADGTGVVAGSQCVISGKSTCPKIGSTGNTDLAAGDVTLVIFWSQWSLGGAQALADLGDLQKKFGPKGLKIVAITSDEPEAVATFLKPGTHPPMTVISMAYGDYGLARFAARENPAILLLDKKGEVRKADVASLKVLTELDMIDLPWLLGSQR